MTWLGFFIYNWSARAPKISRAWFHSFLSTQKTFGCRGNRTRACCVASKQSLHYIPGRVLKMILPIRLRLYWTNAFKLKRHTEVWEPPPSMSFYQFKSDLFCFSKAPLRKLGNSITQQLDVGVKKALKAARCYKYNNTSLLTWPFVPYINWSCYRVN